MTKAWATVGVASAESTALLLMVLVPAAVNPAGEAAFEPLKAGLLRTGAALVAAGWLTWRASGRSTVDVGRHPIVLAGAAVVLLSGLSTFLSVQPAVSFFGTFDRGMGWLTLLAGAVLMISGADLWTDEGRRERLISAMLLGAVIPCIYLLVQRIGRDPINWSTLGAPGSTLASPTFLGGYLVMLVPFGVYRVVSRAHRAGRAYAGWLALLLLIGAVLVQTTIRGPLLGLIAGVFTTAVLLGRPGRAAALGALGFVALAIVLAVSAMGSAGLQGLSRFASVAAAGDSSIERLVVWRDALGLPLADLPRALVGFGPESQAVAFERAEATVRLTQNQVWDRAHNVGLDTWLTGGLIGVVALLVLLAVAAVALGQARAQHWSLVAAVAGALVGHLVEVSFAFETVTSSMLFWVVLGLAASLSPRFGRGQARALALGGALIALLVAPLLATPAIGDALYGAGQLEAASRWMPWAEEPIRAAGLASLRAGDVPRAEADLVEAARRAPGVPTPRLRLLRVYLGQEQLAEAEAACQAALAAGPYRATVWDGCADVSARVGAADEARARRARAETLRQ